MMMMMMMMMMILFVVSGIRLPQVRRIQIWPLRDFYCIVVVDIKHSRASSIDNSSPVGSSALGLMQSISALLCRQFVWRSDQIRLVAATTRIDESICTGDSATGSAQTKYSNRRTFLPPRLRRCRGRHGRSIKNTGARVFLRPSKILA